MASPLARYAECGGRCRARSMSWYICLYRMCSTSAVNNADCVQISLGAGAGRPESAKFSNFANLIAYAFFSVSCVVCGPLVNMWGPRICLALGATGYAVCSDLRDACHHR
jgi:hypothetical protein